MEKTKLEEILINAAVSCKAFSNWIETQNIQSDDDNSLSRNCAEVCNLGVTLIRSNSPILYKFLILCEDFCQIISEKASRYEDRNHPMNCVENAKVAADACRKYRKKLNEQAEIESKENIKMSA